MQVTVIGAGVAGLSCAVELARSGYQPMVFARDLPLESASAHGLGLCLPPQGRAQTVTTAALRDLSTISGTGVAQQEGLLYEQPQPGLVVNLEAYLRYLTELLQDSGGLITRMALTQIPRRGVVVNCTGLAARVLAQDSSVSPCTDLILRTTNPGLSRWQVFAPSLGAATADPLSVVPVPGTDQLLIGGSHASADDLLHQACQHLPELKAARILSQRVVLRGSRRTPRLEAQEQPEGAGIVHCYGQGRADLARSWGDARTVVSLVQGLRERKLF